MDRALAGISASPGIVLGRVRRLLWEVPDVKHRHIRDDEVASELARFNDARERAKEKLESVRERAARHAGPQEAAIFEVQKSMLDDVELLSRVESYVRDNMAAEKAFDVAMVELRQLFGRSPHPMMRERVGDLTDVHIRVLSILLDLGDHDPVDVPKGSHAILVTHDLTPSLTVQLDREAIAGIATDLGTRTSHVAILARSLGLPAVVGLRDATSRLNGDEFVVLDGTSGMLIVNPSTAEIETFQRRATMEAQSEAELQKVAFNAAVTTDAVPVVIRANVDLPEEAGQASRSGANGVGLMRTEFLVVGRTGMPDEDEQYAEYVQVMEAFSGQEVTIRTYDIGGDKLPVGGYPHEPNPFLGWRAIRMCLDEVPIFKVQLRALLRAGAHGKLRILLPLVVTVEEVRRTRQLIAECALELEARGVAFGRDIPVGVMIETPAAAVSADSFIGEADFFSIGTNDLVQYTLAVDRGNANLADRFTPLHPAVLRLIKRAQSVAHDAGVTVSVCGEMASEPLMAFALLGLGIRELSVNPRSVPLVKRLVLGVSASFAAEAAEAAMRCKTAAEARHEFEFRLRAAFGNAAFLGLS